MIYTTGINFNLCFVSWKVETKVKKTGAAFYLFRY